MRVLQSRTLRPAQGAPVSLPTKVAPKLTCTCFGVLTEIDVKATLKKKLDADFRKYAILGTCNPPLAHRALQAELEIGLLLPCNVIVCEEDGGAVVAAINPMAAMSIAESPSLEEVATTVQAKLRRVIEALGEGGPFLKKY